MLVSVRARITGRLLRAYAVKDGYHLYRRGKDVPYSLTTGPKLPGRRLIVTVQSHASGHWHGVIRRLVTIPKDSSVVVRVSSSKLRRGVRYRISARLEPNGTKNILPNSSKYSYFKVT